LCLSIVLIVCSSSGHMDFLERKYIDKKSVRLRLKDMVRVSPLEEDDIRPGSSDSVIAMAGDRGPEKY
jgi:hypothetical protein